MKVFCYFIEPASYTIDLIRNIHEKLRITFCFIKGKSDVESLDNVSAKILSELSLFQKLKIILKNWRANDLIIINGYINYPFILTFIFNVFCINKRYMAIESDTQLIIPNNYLIRFIKWIYLSIIFRNKYVLGLAGGSYTHKELFRNYGMSEDRIFLMPMVVDNNKYYCKEEVTKDIFTFLFVGRFIPTKNINILAKIFIENFTDKQSKLLIVGDGKLFSKFKDLYQNNKIEFCGNISGNDLIKKYHSSSVFIFPSTVEAWGLVINEAMSAGLPVISRNEVGAVHDLIENQQTGFVVNNWDEMKEKMLKIYYDKKLYSQFSKNAVSLMKNKWNYDLYMQCLDNIINRVRQWKLAR